jgi:hypothetical protein
MEIALIFVAFLFFYLIYEIGKRISSLLGHKKRPTYLIRKDPNEDFLDFSFHNTDPNDITSYRTTKEIVESGIYTPDEHRREYGTEAACLPVNMHGSHPPDQSWSGFLF